ncbi:MAG: FtsB family cell division protein [Candidatus Kapaibacteriota bacterium]
MTIFEINKKILRLVVSIAFIVFVVYLLFFSKFGYNTKWKLERERKALLNQIQEEIRQVESLETRLKMLNYDTLEIERVARELYGLVKMNEEVYAIIKKKAN